MNPIPPFVRLAPALFYAAAAVFFLASLTLIYFQAGTMVPPPNSALSGGAEAIAAGVRGRMRLAMIGAVMQAAFGALLLAGIGVICRILLAIASGRSVASVFEGRGTTHEDRY